LPQTTAFRSFFMAGFECACQRTLFGDRLNLTAASEHDRLATEDYRRANSIGMLTVRDGVQWPRVETSAFRYDFSTVLPLVSAACTTGTQVIWDLCHFGWPDDLDVFSDQFIARFAGLARAFAKLLCDQYDEPPYITPINEPSYFAWAAGQVGYFQPYGRGRGSELKRQLVRATIAGIEAVREVHPRARFVNTDPTIVIHTPADRPKEAALGRAFHESQFEARDLLIGNLEPGLGGSPQYLDILGVCYYAYNQLYYMGALHNNRALSLDDEHRVPLESLLRQLHERYGRPLFIAETSAEYGMRRGWLRYIACEVGRAIESGVPVEGICWYPVLNHPGWDDDRPCQHGVWEVPGTDGKRAAYAPLIEELDAQSEKLSALTRSLKYSYGSDFASLTA
jgi:beta-glucosidase/6-phospho-beta-glucosidase/beta-galactosidase